ncbi:MAG: hypothetical protein ACKVS6_11795 [Planctomycetota bacterium]
MNVNPSDPWIPALARRAKLHIVEKSADLVGALIEDGTGLLRIIRTSGSGLDPVFTNFPNLELENVTTGAKSSWSFVNKGVKIQEPGKQPVVGTLLHHILAIRMSTPDTGLLQIVTAAADAGGTQFDFLLSDDDAGCQLVWTLDNGVLVPGCRQFPPCSSPFSCNVRYTLIGVKCQCEL